MQIVCVSEGRGIQNGDGNEIKHGWYRGGGPVWCVENKFEFWSPDMNSRTGQRKITRQRCQKKKIHTKQRTTHMTKLVKMAASIANGMTTTTAAVIATTNNGKNAGTTKSLLKCPFNCKLQNTKQVAEARRLKKSRLKVAWQVPLLKC